MNIYGANRARVEFRKSTLASIIAGLIIGSPFTALAETSDCASVNGTQFVCQGVNGFNKPNVADLLNPWDNVVIETSGISYSTPGILDGRALSFRNFDDTVITSQLLTIKTSGAEAMAIQTENGNLSLTGKTVIETSGEAAAGVLLTNRGTSSVTLGDNLVIDTQDGMGLAAEILSTTPSNDRGNVITVGENATIRTAGAGTNGSMDERGPHMYISRGYGVYSGANFWIDNSRATGHYNHSALVKLGHNAFVETLGDKAHAVYANKTGLIETGDITVLTHGNEASGFVAEDGIKRGPISGSPVQPLSATLLPPTLNQELVAGYVKIFNGGHIYLTRNVNVQVNGDNSYALFATGKDALIRSGYFEGPESEGIYNVKGDMLSKRQGTIDLRMIQGSLFSGAADSTQLSADGQLNTVDNGYIYLDLKGDNSLWDMTASSVITRMDLNDAQIAWRAPKNQQSFTPAYLTVVDNFAGTNGSLRLNTVLGGDDSLTDQLHVLGDVEPGSTKVSINNIGGKGALTQQGIEIITVGGTSYGEFTKAGRIVAGAYDYDVVRKGENWYLVSSVTPTQPPPVDPVPEPKPEPGVDPKPEPGVDPNPEPGPGPLTPLVRPEPGAYLANHAAANGMFVMRLHDRLGETQYTDALTGEKKVTSLWLRQVGGHNVFHSAGQLTTQSNRYIAQLGGDVAQWSTDGKDRWHLGVMGGYANNQSNTRSRWSDYKADGTLSGYSVGVYGTWYADNEQKEGLYTDSWLIYSWFNNRVKGDNLPSESYKSRGLTASVEAGWTEEMGRFYGSQGTLNTWYLQPKAQAIWMGVRSHAHTESNGSGVSFGGDGNVQTRLGLRAYINSHHKMDEGKRREFEPFVEMNWLHNTKTFSATLDDRTISQQGSRNIGEIKTGVEAKLGDRLNMWGNVGVQMGGKGYHDASAMYGIKYQF